MPSRVARMARPIIAVPRAAMAMAINRLNENVFIRALGGVSSLG